jgi:hypothetical protein
MKTAPCYKAEEAKCSPQNAGKSATLYRWEDMLTKSEEPDSISEEFDTRDFLKCNQYCRRQEEDEKESNPYSFVLNNSKIANFIR